MSRLELKLSRSDLNLLLNTISKDIIQSSQRAATAYFANDKKLGDGISAYVDSLKAVERKIKYVLSRNKGVA